MNRKTYVIDTNVLLHDPEAIVKFNGNDVVIPLVVIEELDALKRFTDELGKNARQVIRFIDSLKNQGHLHEGVAVDNDVVVRLHFDTTGSERKGFPLPLEKKNRILYSAFQLQSGGNRVVVVSKDFIVRVKAEAIGIEAQNYLALRLSYDEMYKGYRRIEVPKHDIDLFFKNGYLDFENGFLPNEYCLLTCPEQSSAVCKYNRVKKRLEPLTKLSRDIWGVNPLNLEQKCALDLLLRDDIKLCTLIGPAGTGKTLLALATGLKKVFDDDVYNRILVSRPIVPLGKDIGYLPGTKEEKLYHWMQPIYDNLEFLCNTSDQNSEETQKWILESKKIEMEAVTYIRGRSLPKMYMIIDEAQNLTPHEVKTIISRAGQGTKVVLTGDPTQIDNPYLDKDSNALTYIVGRFKESPLFGHMFLERTERSELAAQAAEML